MKGRQSVLARLQEDDPELVWLAMDGWSAVTTGYIGAEICQFCLLINILGNIYICFHGTFFNYYVLFELLSFENVDCKKIDKFIFKHVQTLVRHMVCVTKLVYWLGWIGLDWVGLG